MDTSNGLAAGLAQDPTKAGMAQPTADPKGKGKAVASDEEMGDASMIEDDNDDDDEEDGAEAEDDDDEEGEDDMGEIDLDNVVGRRTRGRVIDFAKAAEELPAEEDDEDDEDDDDDFEDPEEKMDED